MTNVEFYKQQAKRLLKDYNSRVFDEEENCYSYSPLYFGDIKSIIRVFHINEDGSFTLMKAQHIIAQLSGFRNWNELINAPELSLEIGKQRLTYREQHQHNVHDLSSTKYNRAIDDWEEIEKEIFDGLDYQNKLEFIKRSSQASASFEPLRCDQYMLDLFKRSILSNDKTVNKTTFSHTIDFSDSHIAQDMLSTIMKKTKLPPDEALLSTITSDNFDKILTTGWGEMAVSWWGHDDPYRKYEKLDNPIVQIKLTQEKESLVDFVARNYNVSFCDALLYYMVFTLDSLGYHI